MSDLVCVLQLVLLILFHLRRIYFVIYSNIFSLVTAKVYSCADIKGMTPAIRLALTDDELKAVKEEELISCISELGETVGWKKEQADIIYGRFVVGIFFDHTIG